MTLLRSLLRNTRKRRQEVSEFEALLDFPEDSTVTLPASGRFRVRSDTSRVAGVVACVIAGATERTIRTPVMDAGDYITIDHIEADCVVTLSAGFELMLDVGFGSYARIASAI